MKFIEFSEQDSVKINSIDAQHKEIIDTINKLYKHFLDNNKTNVITNLNRLSALLKKHFETEELLMKEHNYPGYISHKLEHDRYYTQTLKTIDQYQEDDKSLGLEQFDSFKRWFFNHLDFNDKKCGQYLHSLGLS